MFLSFFILFGSSALMFSGVARHNLRDAAIGGVGAVFGAFAVVLSVFLSALGA